MPKRLRDYIPPGMSKRENQSPAFKALVTPKKAGGRKKKALSRALAASRSQRKKKK